MMIMNNLAKCYENEVEIEKNLEKDFISFKEQQKMVINMQCFI